MAGSGEVCSHDGAVIFAIEYGVTLRDYHLHFQIKQIVAGPLKKCTISTDLRSGNFVSWVFSQHQPSLHWPSTRYNPQCNVLSAKGLININSCHLFNSSLVSQQTCAYQPSPTRFDHLHLITYATLYFICLYMYFCYYLLLLTEVFRTSKIKFTTHCFILCCRLLVLYYYYTSSF